MPSYGISDQGLKRLSNQDSYLLLEKDNIVAGVVCDGIGGNRAGDVASKVACESFIKKLQNDLNSPNKKELIYEATVLANTDTFATSLSKTEYAGMGTTLVGFIDDGKDTYVVNVGDSRCYSLNKKKLTQVSKDHTLVNELMEKHGFTEAEALKITGRNVISRAVGIMAKTEIDVFKVENYQCLMLCSDGLHSYVEQEKILEVLNSRKTLKSKCERLVELANEAGGLDNVTIVLYQR